MMIITSFVPRSRDYRASRAAYDANEIKRKNSREFVSAGRSFGCAQDKLGQAGSLCSPILCRYLRI